MIKKLRLYYYKKLKQNCKLYEIEITDGLFGRFGGLFKDYNTHIVLARTHIESIYRLRKRGISRNYNFSGILRENDKFARYKVRELSKPKTKRHITYFS